MKIFIKKKTYSLKELAKYIETNNLAGSGIPSVLHAMRKAQLTENYEVALSSMRSASITLANIILGRGTPDTGKTDPKHYSKYGYEPIEFIQHITPDFMDVVFFNVVKYTIRWEDKDGVTDLAKAKWYIDKGIDMLEEQYAEVTKEIK